MLRKRSRTPRLPPTVPTVRRPSHDFSAVPRHWFHGNAVGTHIANGLHLLFPAGERFFVRSVRHFADRIRDPELIARIKAFYGQEGAHSHEHDQATRMLERQGFEVRAFLSWYERLAFEQLAPRFSAATRLSVTVALEHFTAILAERGLSTTLLDRAHPEMRDLLRWHAAEEIEHRSVAFDVLQQVDARYRVRLLGLVIATVGLMFFWRRATAMLLQQEPGIGRWRAFVERQRARQRGQDDRALIRAFLEYLGPGFHPDQRPTDHLAREYLARFSDAA